jgi:hypothetical protein
MLRSLLVLSILILVPSVSYAVDPKEKSKPTDYLPTDEGAAWVYRVGDREQTQVVSEVKEKNGAKIVVMMGIANGRKVPAKTMSLTPEGVFMLSMGKLEYDPPICVLKLPIKEGEEWPVRLVSGKDEFKLTHTTRKVEKLKFQNGTYEAIPVTVLGNVAGKDVVMTQWYAPGVGLVKVNQGEKTVQELKVFTPAGFVPKEDDKPSESVDPKMTSDDADYGHSEKKPIKVGSQEGILGGPDAERAYLNSLRDETGRAVMYVRVGSVGKSPDGNIMDSYEVKTLAGKKFNLYIDMYHPKNEPEKQLAPKGLYKAKE